MTEQIENRQEQSGSEFNSSSPEARSRDSSGASAAADSGESKVVSARGTEDGLVLRIDGKAAWDEILGDIEQFLGGRKKFFEGGQVSLEWLDRLPTIEQSKQLEDLLRNGYGIELVVKRKRPSRLVVAGGNDVEGVSGRPVAAGRGGAENRELTGKEYSSRDMSSANDSAAKQKRAGVTINLFDEVTAGSLADPEIGIESEGRYAAREGSGEQHRRRGERDEYPRGESFGLSQEGFSRTGGSLPPGVQMSGREFDPGSVGEPYSGSKKFASRTARMLGDDLFYEDDANAKIFFGTLRSGQRLETPFSLIVIGDVNPGADLVAGGDIIVFGGLRGTAHASAYDDDAYDRVIIALQMQPMQLRIGSVISRGSDERVRGAEIARIENRRIIVEAFHPKSLAAASAAGKKFR